MVWWVLVWKSSSLVTNEGWHIMSVMFHKCAVSGETLFSPTYCSLYIICPPYRIITFLSATFHLQFPSSAPQRNLVGDLLRFRDIQYRLSLSHFFSLSLFLFDVLRWTCLSEATGITDRHFPTYILFPRVIRLLSFSPFPLISLFGDERNDFTFSWNKRHSSAHSLYFLLCHSLHILFIHKQNTDGFVYVNAG